MLSRGDLLKGQYKIVDVVGKGGQGCVYRANDLKKGYFERSEVAIKEMRRGSDLMTDMINIDFFRQEVQILAKLRHPYLPRIFDVFSESGNFYIVEEFIDGQTMEVFLRKEGRLPALKAVDLALRIADILDFLHQQDPPIYYRDLKPANLLMQPGRLYLVDFSGCYIPLMGFGEGVAIRTRGYCPPEAYTTSTADASFDVYTLGMLMYQMLTGDNVSNFTGTPPALNPGKEGIMPEVAAIVNKAIKKNKMARYHTIWEMKLELEKVEKLLRSMGPQPVSKEGLVLPPPKTPFKFALRGMLSKALYPVMDVLVFLMIPLMIVRPVYAKFLPFARGDGAAPFFLYLVAFLIFLIHIPLRHWLDWFELCGRYFRYLHFPIRNYLDVRPIRWLTILEIIMILYIYLKLVTL
ncbi:MAG: serine/threonine protein kinase [Firmicutes bacterium]|nr:serine/threonine protein kinase [Bacillota bacterium]